MRGVLLTHCSAEYEALAQYTDIGKRDWCSQWGWEYVKVQSGEGNGNPCVQWDRPVLWRKVLDTCDAMFFLGCDAMVTNHEKPPFLAHDLTIACEGAGINNDSFFMLKNTRTLSFLDDLIVWPRKHGISEQDGMTLLLSGLPNIFEVERRVQVTFKDGGLPSSPHMRNVLQWLFQHRMRVRVVDQRELNAYPVKYYAQPEDSPHGWHPGDFVLHMPGMTLEKRIEVAKSVLTFNTP
jgi:hypothetical protein